MFCVFCQLSFPRELVTAFTEYFCTTFPSHQALIDTAHPSMKVTVMFIYQMKLTYRGNRALIFFDTISENILYIFTFHSSHIITLLLLTFETSILFKHLKCHSRYSNCIVCIYKTVFWKKQNPKIAHVKIKCTVL